MKDLKEYRVRLTERRVLRYTVQAHTEAEAIAEALGRRQEHTPADEIEQKLVGMEASTND